MDYNKTILSGRLTRDPEIREATQTGNTICRFGIASNRTYKKKDGETLNNETVFVDCVAFGKTGQAIGDYFAKGKPILIDGRLHFAQWEDKASGDKRNKIEIIVDSFIFMGGKSDEGNQPQAAPQAAQAAPQAAASGDDVPF